MRDESVRGVPGDRVHWRCGDRSVRLTTVVAQLPGGKTRINFVITTQAHAEINMWGLAAVYLRGQTTTETPGAWWNSRTAGAAQILRAQPGALPEHLYVFSPKGQLFGFDRGSTCLLYTSRCV